MSGRVFTLNQWVHREIPSTEDVLGVCSNIHRTCLKEDSIRSAILHGSLIRGHITVRSTVNLFYQFEDEQEEAAKEAIRGLIAQASQAYVRIKYIPCRLSAVQDGTHGFGPLFLRHLREAVESDGLLKGSPLLRSPMKVATEVEQYLAKRVESLTRDHHCLHQMDDTQVAYVLEKAASIPMRIVRCMLEHRRVVPAVDTKRNLLEEYRRQFPMLSPAAERLIRTDAEYTEMLTRQRTRVDENEYLDALEKMKQGIEPLICLLRENLAALTHPS